MVIGENGGNSGSRSGGRKGDLARAERLSKALRDNLKRRKTQAKGRSAEVRPPAENASGATHDSAGFVQEFETGKSKR